MLCEGCPVGGDLFVVGSLASLYRVMLVAASLVGGVARGSLSCLVYQVFPGLRLQLSRGKHLGFLRRLLVGGGTRFWDGLRRPPLREAWGCAA